MPLERPVFDQVNIVVRDMAASTEFYRRLGLELPEQGPWNTYHRSATTRAGLDLDFDTVEFTRKWNAGWPGRAGGGVVVGFKVAARDAVDAIHADMVEAGYRSQQEPYDAFWGSRYAVIEDPDGNAVGIMSPMDDDYRSAPPEE
jgi:catechol 2,3-dioxygenase-like lactoylglutathione lyase family enzyme